MSRHDASVLGGRACAIVERERAIERYYQNPNYCKQCGNLIKVRENERVADVKMKVFCNHSCRAIYYNVSRKKPINNCCPICKKKISPYAKYCREHHRIEMPDYRGLKTKGELFKSRKNYQSARSAIRQHAELVYARSGKQKVCKICGYSNHAEISHIKSVSSFPDTALISEINDINNLIALCPNHHWEFDNGLLKL
jgi:hypothetical protein